MSGREGGTILCEQLSHYAYDGTVFVETLPFATSVTGGIKMTKLGAKYTQWYESNQQTRHIFSRRLLP